MKTKLTELYGVAVTEDKEKLRYAVTLENCPFLSRKCLKNRKSMPDQTIGTCSVGYGKVRKDIIICPHRFLNHNKIFSDCLHLLTRHDVGNDYHVLPEITVPGGSVDYVLTSSKKGKVKDFVGIELQALDTTGTVYPERQKFVKFLGLSTGYFDAKKTYGMNWKMTAKTILVQLHHKVTTFETLGKHLVLVLQDYLFDYMNEEFDFSSLNAVTKGDSMHFHPYSYTLEDGEYKLDLQERKSTDASGIASCLGIKSDPNIGLEAITSYLESKLDDQYKLTIV